MVQDDFKDENKASRRIFYMHAQGLIMGWGGVGADPGFLFRGGGGGA